MWNLIVLQNMILKKILLNNGIRLAFFFGSKHVVVQFQDLYWQSYIFQFVPALNIFFSDLKQKKAEEK